MAEAIMRATLTILSVLGLMLLGAGAANAQEAKDVDDPWIALAAQEHEARAAARCVLLRRQGTPVVAVREELLEQAVLEEYERLRRARRV